MVDETTRALQRAGADTIGRYFEGDEEPPSDIGHPLFLAILEFIADLHRKKAAGYAGTEEPDTFKNFREAENWGLSASQGCEVRLGDKYRRYQNVRRNADNDQLGETLFDTGVDGASYFLIDLCLLYEEGLLELPDHPAFADLKGE